MYKNPCTCCQRGIRNFSGRVRFSRAARRRQSCSTSPWVGAPGLGTGRSHFGSLGSPHANVERAQSPCVMRRQNRTCAPRHAPTTALREQQQPPARIVVLTASTYVGALSTPCRAVWKASGKSTKPRFGLMKVRKLWGVNAGFKTERDNGKGTSKDDTEFHWFET